MIVLHYIGYCNTDRSWVFFASHLLFFLSLFVGQCASFLPFLYSFSSFWVKDFPSSSAKWSFISLLWKQNICIPLICHFFYIGRIFKTKFYTQKNDYRHQKHYKCLWKSQKYAFFSLNLEKFTPHRKFLHRHVCGVCDK